MLFGGGIVGILLFLGLIAVVFFFVTGQNLLG